MTQKKKMTQTQNPNDTSIKQQGQGVWDFLHNIAWKCAAVWLCTYCPIVHEWVKRQWGKYKRSTSEQPSRVKGRVPVSSSLTREKIPLRCVTQSHRQCTCVYVHFQRLRLVVKSPRRWKCTYTHVHCLCSVHKVGVHIMCTYTNIRHAFMLIVYTFCKQMGK